MCPPLLECVLSVNVLPALLPLTLRGAMGAHLVTGLWLLRGARVEVAPARVGIDGVRSLREASHA